LEDGLSVVHSSVRQFCVYRCWSVVIVCKRHGTTQSNSAGTWTDKP